MRGLLVAHLVLVSREAAEPIEDLNMAPPPTPILKEKPPRITSSASPSLCSCDDSNNTNSFLEHAKTMKEAMRNKTTLLSKIRHRTTHSHDAVWASISLTLVVTLLVVGVLHSRMWQQRPHVSSMDSQPIKFIQWNPLAEIKVFYSIVSRRSPCVLGEETITLQRSSSPWYVWRAKRISGQKYVFPEDGGLHDRSGHCQ